MAAAVRSVSFGTVAGKAVERYELRGNRITVSLLSYGATIQALHVPDASGEVGDVALGFDELAGYTGEHPYFGSVIGRFANRIAGGTFELDGERYELPCNYGTSSLHGGTEGFDRRVWDSRAIGRADRPGVEFQLESPDGDMGYPGTLRATVTYTLHDSDLTISYRATTDRPTVVNLTNHVYFNLSGAGSGTVENSRLRLAATRYTPVDENLIPTGELAGVDGTAMDFRHPKAIGADLRAGSEQLVRAKGYDHNWVLDAPADGARALGAQVHDPSSGRVLEVWTDQPGVQFYSGNFLDGSLVGKGGRTYRQGDGFCLETQHFPDSPNHDTFPSTVLRPGEHYATSTTFRFGVRGTEM